ncbi:LGI4 [Branchiostoma lanceolatum]|uniref:LGI4 protein n=1 Tax=Branchiostoma lanceolatum TaxID=7740 RepID=A0A8K0EGJ9_BRALA|nr:LGI4 [Branchiostoma lanceolatum]
MEKRSRQRIVVLLLLVLKFSLPCPEECFVQNQFVFMKSCECPKQRVTSFTTPCLSRGFTVAANSVCSAENHGLTCLNDVPTGFDNSVTRIILNCLFNLTTLTQRHIPCSRNLNTFIISYSTIQAIAFVGLNRLNKIALEGNQLKAVPFDTLSLIRRSTTVARLQVNLESNQISAVPETGWKKISDTGVTLRLKGNPFDCDGRMRWLVCNAPTSALDHIFQTEPTSLSAEPSGTTNFALTQRARIITLGTTDSTRGLVLEKNLDDGHQDGMDYLYIPVGLTVAGVALLGGTAVAVMIYKRRVAGRRQNPVHGQHGIIISSQLISNRMYQHSGSVTGDGRDKEETEDETEEASARQNPVRKRHGVTINASELISNRLYKSSGSAINNSNKGTETAEETELTPYLTVPFDAINNTLRIEPYSSVNLDDIRDEQRNVASGGISVSRKSPAVRDEDDMEPYCITPLDQIGDS